jgi:DNA-3-methyladenine glycosylase
VLEVARDLVGCVVAHGETAGVIVETEAYHQSEAACHAYVGVTPRTATLFGAPGVAYVYRSYGIHAMLNAVCEPEGVGAAVLIRALEPTDGLDLMRVRRGVGPERQVGNRRVGDRNPHASHSDRRPQASRSDLQLCSGPGKLTVALGIELDLNQTSLLDGPIAISGRPAKWRSVEIVADRRIGITKAAELPWRFTAAGNRYVSRRAAPA